MATSYPSVQAFYRPEPALVTTEHHDPVLSTPGDGFTKAELENALDPLKSPFNPSRKYLQCDIGTLSPGPQAVTFTGRVVNFTTQYGRSKSHAAATGWHHLIVKDDTGAICVKLYFLNKPYALKLGLLLTIWTPYIGTVVSNKAYIIPNAPNISSIFPDREGSVHIVIHRNSDVGDTCHLPLEYSKQKPLPGIKTLKDYIAGAYEVKNNRLLVCVKSIGPKRKITNKKGGVNELTEVTVFDDTAETVLKLWGEQGNSARDWKPSETILLFLNPNFRNEAHGCSLGLSHATMVDVDPDFPDAEYIRKYAVSLNKKESMDQTFPEDLWDIDATMTAANRILFTIADVDDRARTDPQSVFTGFLSLTIMEINLVLNFRRNMLMCTQCCGVPMYANEPVAKCKNCNKELELQLNPKVIGSLIDETGSIAAGKLLWSAQAWEDLFGRSVEELVAMDIQMMKLMEQRMAYMRVHLVFGWAEEVGKLAILAVRM